MRNVPDVSLNSDQYTGYSIYFKGRWQIIGGTSCAAPIWAAFTARVNQQRVANGFATLGFANPLIYQLARSAKYGTDFNDIADGSTNLYYKAIAGYDNSTGWGSFNGANLLADLASVAPSAATMVSPANATTLAGTTQAFTWTNAGANLYQIWVGTTAGAGDIGYFPAAGTTATTFTVTGLPTNGGILYVRLWSRFGTTWIFNDYTYSAGP
jgi:kumamolisin